MKLSSKEQRGGISCMHQREEILSEKALQTAFARDVRESCWLSALIEQLQLFFVPVLLDIFDPRCSQIYSRLPFPFQLSKVHDHPSAKRQQPNSKRSNHRQAPGPI